MTDPDHRHVVRGDRRNLSYGPARDDAPGAWSLGITTADGDRVALQLDEEAMYDLWTEVHDVPWPRDDDRAVGDLRQRIVERIERMDEPQLRVVLGAILAAQEGGVAP